MTINEVKKEVERLMKLPKISDNELKEIISTLETIKEDNREFYLRAMTGLLIKKDRTSYAKTYLNELFEDSARMPSDYYDSYKINVVEGNYIDAYLDLFKYKKLLGAIDVSLPLTMLEQIIDIENTPNLYLQTDYSIPQTYALFGFYLKKISHLPRFHKIIDLFNARKYKEMVNKLKTLIYIAKKEPYQADLKSILELAKVLERKTDALQTQSEIDRKEAPLTPQQEETLNEKTQELEGLSEETKLVLIHHTMQTDYKLAKELLKELEESTPILYDVELRYLKNCIREKELAENLSQEQKTAYSKALTEGLDYIHYRAYETAYDYFLYGKYITNHPIFDYYMGYCLFKTYHDEEAYQTLSNYREHGGEKLLEALTLLKNLDKKNLNRNQAEEKELDQAKIVQTYKLDYRYLPHSQNKVKELTLSQNTTTT